MSSKREAPAREFLSPKNLLIRGIPPEFLDLSIKDYRQDIDIKKKISNYLKNIHDAYENRVCLILYGANGTGKSFLASLIVKEAYRCRYSSCMITMAKLMDLNFKRDKDKEDYYKLSLVNDTDFLVIDEVGKENFTKTQSNVVLLEETLRQAMARGQVVIICTNIPLEDVGKVKGLYSQYGNSIKSLIEGQHVKIEFEDDDYRHEVLRNKPAVKKIFGEED